MARPSVVGEYRALLEPYLEAKMAAYVTQVGTARAPTLPSHGGKVNVRQVTLDLGLAQTREFHFFTKPELRGLINLVATRQGLSEIGSTRVPGDPEGDGTGEDDEAAKLLAAQRAETKRQTEGHAVKSAEVSRLIRRVAELELENGALQRKCAALEARLGHVQRTGLLIRTEAIRA